MRQLIKVVSLHLMAWLVLTLVFVTPAQSTETQPSTSAIDQAKVKHDAADELVQLLHADSLAEEPKRLLSLYAKKMADQALKENANLTATQKSKLNQLPASIGDIVQRNLKWDRLLAAFAEIYRKVYTPEEIKAQLQFYRSKEGQSILSKLPRLASQLALEESVSLRPVYVALQKVITEQVKAIVSSPSSPLSPSPPSSAASSP